jgi:hypothetical protein
VSTTSTPEAAGGGSASVAFLKEAVLATIASSCEVTVQVTARGTTLATGAGAVDFYKHLVRLDLTLDTVGATNLIVDGEYVYLNFARLRPLLGARPWFRATYDQLAGVGRLYGLGALANTPATDPTQATSLIAGATGPITVVGTATIRGAATTEYQVTIDPSLVAAQADPTTNAGRVARLLGSRTFPLTLWIDAQGRDRMVRYTVASPTTDPADAPTANVEYFGFGDTVGAVAPPDDQVRDLSGLGNYAGSAS